MKIGIITFHNAENYGAMLQTIALKYTLTKLGTSCEIIDYHNAPIDIYYKLKWKQLLWDYIKNPLNVKVNLWNTVFMLGKLRRKLTFNKSERQYICAKKYDKISPDLVLFGSDQIWNEHITNNDLTYYGDLSYASDVKKISYAASLGSGDKESLRKNRILLSTFQRIGVREESLRKELEEMGLSAELNADPSLLLSAEEWEKLFDLTPNTDRIKERYIFLYTIRDHTKLRRYAKRVAESNNLKLVEIPSYESFSYDSIKYKHTFSTIKDFVRLLRNAEAVITDSFHGSAFSIVFNKRFVSAKLGNKGDDRMSSLVILLGLQDNFQDVDNLSNDLPPSQSPCSRKLLCQFREESINLLKDYIEC